MIVALAVPALARAQRVRRLEPILAELARPATRAEILRQAVIDPLATPETQPFGGALAIERIGPARTAMVGVFARVRSPAGVAAIRAVGGDVGAVIGDYVSARIPLTAVDALAESPDIVTVEAARALRMDNDSGTHAIGADKIRTLVDGRWTGATGEGTIVGVYDTGLDLLHDDFIDPDGMTRVLGVWDQTTAGVPPPGFTSGSYCSAEDVQTAVETGGASGCSERDFHGHGTHVAGTAVGDGSAGGPNPFQFSFAGVAPGADLLIVNGGPGVFFEDRIIDGLTWMRQEGLRLGRPVVVNLSLGGQFGAHDGSRLYERMIDALSGPGFIVVIAAGNAGVNRNTDPLLPGPHIHARGVPTGTQTTEFTFEIPPYTPNRDACNGNNMLMSLWYDALDSLRIEVVRPDGSSAAQVRGQAVLNEAVTGRIIIDNGSSGTDPENGDVEAAITLNGCGTSGVPSTGTWRIRVTPTRAGSGRPYDMWIWAATGAQPEGNVGFDNRFVVGSPGNARRAITVGAFVTKLCWPSIATTQMICYTQREEPGDLARFSGGGPTRDGRIKPEITAPGLGVVSSHSRDASIATQRIAPDNAHATREGTSMATPHVAGAIAVLLAQDPDLTPEGVRAALAGSAFSDAFTSRTYDVAAGAAAPDWWGFGKLDLPAALLAVSETGPATLALDAASAVFGSPTLGRKGTRLGLLRLDLDAQGAESIDVTAIGFDLTGNDPAARVVLLRDNGNGAVDGDDTEVAGMAVALTEATGRVVIQPSALRIAPFSPMTVFLAIELSGRAPNGASFTARFEPSELHTVGASTGELDRIEDGLVAVGSGTAATTLLEGLLSFSENPVCGPRSPKPCRGDVTFNFSQSPTRAAVYTVTGRLVIDLCRDAGLECGGATGPAYVRWDLHNDEGEPVASGIYLIVFNVENTTLREKLMILVPPGTSPESPEQQP